MRTITFQSGDLTLHADVHETQGEWAALNMHGWTGWRGGSSGELAQRLLELGVTSLCVDLPGHGDSDGPKPRSVRDLDKEMYMRAAADAYDELVRICPGRRVLIVGTSFGGYLAARLVAERSADALALRVPANYQPFEQAIQAVQAFAGDVYVLEAAGDDVIPWWMVEGYAHASSRAVHEVLAGAPHSISTIPAKLAESNDMLAGWLAKR
jgi:pimeloyl-ACP methyl ester carboxylesterase